MGVLFSRASTTSLRNTGSIAPTSLPITFGGWFRFRVSDANAHIAMAYGDGANRYAITKTTGNVINMDLSGVGTVALTGLFLVNEWTHLIIRLPATNNQRFSGIRGGVFIANSGALAAGALTATIVSLGADQNGTTSPADLDVADFWCAYGDFYRSDANLPEALHREIAHNGPWVFPTLANNLRWFFSFQDGYHVGLADTFWFQTQPIAIPNGHRLLQPFTWLTSSTPPAWGESPPKLNHSLGQWDYRLRIPGRRYFHVAAAVGGAVARPYNLATTGVGL